MPLVVYITKKYYILCRDWAFRGNLWNGLSQALFVIAEILLVSLDIYFVIATEF